MEIIQSASELRAAIAGLSASAKAVNAEIHRLAVSCLAHVRDHNDWTPAADLCAALPNGQRVKALAFWFNHFSSGKFRLSLGKDGWKGSLAKDRERADFRVEESAETTFGDLTAERDPAIKTTKALIDGLQRAGKRDEINEKGQRVTTGAAKALAKAMAAFGQKLLDTPEFSALRGEEITQIEAEKLLRDGAVEEPLEVVVTSVEPAVAEALAVINS